MSKTVLEVVMVPEGDAVGPPSLRSAKPRGSLRDAVRLRQDCVPCRDKANPTMTAAVIIPCRDYGRFLAEAVESAFGQTRRPSEIVVVDDGSTDDTPAVAASFAGRGVRYVRGEWGSVWEARKAGFLATTADALCFLDADDVLPPDYLERGLPLFGSRVGVVYSDYELFGDEQGRSSFPTFDRSALERDNYMHAGSLVRRRALEVAQAFDYPPPGTNTHADWYGWRRLADAGFGAVKSPALYRYRRHGSSMMAGIRAAAPPYYDHASLAHQAVTIVCPLSGRDWAWPAYRGWLEAQAWPRAQCRLLVLDTGPTEGVREWLAGCDYPDARYVRLDVASRGVADRDRVAHVAEVRLAMCRIYSRAFAGLETPFTLIVEDDVLPQPDVIGRLMRGFDHDVAAVSAPYRSRFHAGYVAWGDSGLGSILHGGAGVEDVGGTGFGCALIRRAVLAGETFASLPGESADYDVAFFARLRKSGWRVRVDWDCPADHRGKPDP